MPVKLVLPLIMAIVASAAAPSFTTPRDTPPAGLKTTHALGYYDDTLRRVVLMGSAMDPRAGDRDQAWSWTGTSWEAMAGEGPPARSNGVGAYDAGRGIAIVSGGARYADDSAFVVIADTWEGSSAGWGRISGTDIAPRDHHAMVYDGSSAAVLMFGGIPAKRSDAWPAETRQLRPGGWVPVATEGPAPRARTALAYDTVRRHVVLFGGVGASPGPGRDQPFFSDTWIWQDKHWKKVAADGPRARYAHGMVFDERAGVVLLYSGAAAHRNAHRARQRTVLYGGLDGSKDDTWEWDGKRWSLALP